MPATVTTGYPADFVWGVSTSAYQVEGAVEENGRGASIWDIRCKTKGGIGDGSNADVACDHYHRWPEDVALMKAIGVDAYRFSIAWPRLLPRGKGVVNEKGLAFYDRLIDSLLESGIEPWVCLYHWDLPQALHDLGGWTSRDCAGWVADYAALCARRYGDRVKHWGTVNEPSVFTIFGYAFGWGAPSVADRAMHLKAIHSVNLAHGAGVDALRALVSGASIGCIHSHQPCRPERDDPDCREAAALFDELWNRAFPDPQILGHYPPRLAAAMEPYMQAGDMARIGRPVDWFGVNHYAPMYAAPDAGMVWGCGFGAPPADMPRSDVGWPLEPAAMRENLLTIHARYRLPIYVTENGCGGSDVVDAAGQGNDPHRIAYLTIYHEAMRAAMRDGADVRGYFVWSLLDNFEWGTGYGTRFGIVHVDFETLKRTPKASAKWYADLIKAARAAA